MDGVPCFWADVPGPAQVGLLFRVGRADEQLASGGITQLAAPSARVGAVTTALYGTVEAHQVAGLVESLATRRGDPPADDPHAPTTVERMLMMRFGAAGHGLAFYEPFGARRLGPDQVGDWARRWFTRGNAALWMTCPPPAGLRLGLPDGPRVPVPSPEAIAGLDLPAFAAAGTDVIASTMVAPRSPAIAAAGRTVAGRLGDATTWQFPIAADLSHRYLGVPVGDDALTALTAAFDAVAADGPTREELNDAAQAAVHAIADDEAVPGGLERMAVDELLGAARRSREDLVHEAESVSYAEVAAALREALTTQILLVPADAQKPAERFHDYPWFARDRIEGRPLRARGRGQGVRLVVAQEGISHVADATGQASTVRFGGVAAALQEPDGSLTLIGRDGAIVPIDPQAYKGAGQVVADLEQRLPPELIVPPRESGRLEQIARRKLRPGAPVGDELRLLRDRLDPDERPVTLCQAVIGFKGGVLLLTDRRVIWLHLGPRDPMVRELPYGDVRDVKVSRIPSLVMTIKSPAGETAFSQIQPKERATELAEEVRRRSSVGG